MWLEQAWQDARYAARALRRSPGFAFVAVLTLALGIGANTAIFSLVNAVLLRPLPFPESDRMVRIVERFTLPIGGMTVEQPILTSSLIELRRGSRTLAGVDAYGESVEMRFGDAALVEAGGARVSRDTLTRLGARVVLGRLFDQEETAAMAPVVVVSSRVWRQWLGGGPAAIGRPVMVEGSTQAGFARQWCTVIGVMADDFAFPNAQTDFWLPYSLPGSVRTGVNNAPNVAWLAPGVSVAAANQEVTALLARLRGEPASNFEVIGLQENMIRSLRPTLRLLLFAVGLVLLVACANVANLQMSRATARMGELTLRAALGASRARLIRQTLTESVVLSIAGAAAGLVFAAAAFTVMRPLISDFGARPGGFRVGQLRQIGVDPLHPGIMPPVDAIGIDASTLLFTAIVSLATAVMFGVAPALRTAGGCYMTALREGAGAAAAGFGLFRRHAMRTTLVVAQVALAVTLLIGGGVIVHGFVRILFADNGYDPQHALTFQIRVPKRYFTTTTRDRYASAFAERLSTIPGVRAAGYSTTLPGATSGFTAALRVGQQPVLTPNVELVSRGFPEAMGMRLVAGRGFGPSRGGAHRELLITEALARQLSGNPIGSPVSLDLGPFGGEANRSATWDIVGVLADVRNGGPDQPPRPEIYVDLADWVSEDMGNLVMPHYYVVRTAGPESAVLAATREAAHALDGNVELDNVMPLASVLGAEIARPRMYAALFGAFGVLALVVAAVGIFGVMSYAVAQSTRELGIRMALGATRRQVRWLVLGRAAMLTGAGISLGVAGAFVLGQSLRSMVFGVTPLDPATYAGVIAGFALTALLASYLPARSATQVNPLVALRYE